jgi:signal transduction histidine kinase
MNPLASFKNTTALLVDDYDGFTEDDRFEFLTMMKQSANDLHNLLENLLSWSRTQTGKVQNNPEEHYLKTISEFSVSPLMGNAKSKDIEIVDRIDEEAMGYFDANMISTVIRNLVSNAIKFTDERGEINIESIDMRDFVKISISDNGVGIDEDDIEKLFRLDLSHTTVGTNQEKGTGLGLVLCKEFVEQNGGKIEVSSSLGHGTTFSFTVPAVEKDISIDL